MRVSRSVVRSSEVLLANRLINYSDEVSIDLRAKRRIVSAPRVRRVRFDYVRRARGVVYYCNF